MGFVRSALVVLALSAFSLATVARADSDGVPFIAGSWKGKIKATYWDQTNQASNKPKLKYRDKVDVVIDQGVGELEMDIEFKDGMPTSTDTVLTSATLDGFVGNYHMSVNRSLVAPLLVGSGTINKKATRIKLKGVAASGDVTMEFTISLKKTGN